MTPTAARRRESRRAMGLVLACLLLLLVGVLTAERVEVFTDLAAFATPEGDQYLVYRHRTFDPFEEDGFAFQYREAHGEWERADRLSGSYMSAGLSGGELVVCHGSGTSFYDGLRRASFRELPVDWEVRALRMEGEKVRFFGGDEKELRSAVLADSRLVEHENKAELEAEPGRVRVVLSSEGILVFWNRRPREDDHEAAIWCARAGEEGLADPRRADAPCGVEMFDVVERDGEIWLYLYERDASGEHVLYQARWADGELADASEVPYESREPFGNRVLGFAAVSSPSGEVRLYLATLASIRVLATADPRNGEWREEEPIAGLSSLGRWEIILWLVGLATVSILLLWSGVSMIRGRLSSAPRVRSPFEGESAPRSHGRDDA
ncbi:MAG: hypothetical protein HY720_06360 [Planctomycetes bacterium]|nr:hypothetical protein [Planctomycetota bacterium]